MKYLLAVTMGLLALLSTACGLNNFTNPIYKHKPEDVFESPQLEIAKAIRKDRPGIIKQLIENDPAIDLDKAGKDGITLLFWALAHRHPDTARQLLKMGANPDTPWLDKEGVATYAIAMAASGKSDKTFELLLEYGANPDGDIEGTPAIFKTIYARRFDRMRVLLDHGANIDAIDKQTNLSLAHFCSKLMMFDQVAYLIERGADFKRKSGVGGSVAYQVQKRRGELNDHSEKWRTIVEQMLVERGVEFPIAHPYELRKKREKQKNRTYVE